MPRYMLMLSPIGRPMMAIEGVERYRDRRAPEERAQADGLTSVIDKWISPVGSDGQEQIVWTAYEVPDDYALLADEIKKKKSFTFEVALGIARAAFSDASKIGFLGGPTPPSTK